MEEEMEHPLTVYITAHTLISSLGFGTQENMEAIRAYRSGVCPQPEGLLSDTPILAATIDVTPWNKRVDAANIASFPRLEQLFILAIQEVLSQSGADLSDPDCALLLSTTKGNIDLLADLTEASTDSTPFPADSPVFLWKMAERIGDFFQSVCPVEVVSNACISGVSALIIAKRWIESGRYKRVIVAGGDVLSPFITSGFLSFKSVSTQRCRPYDIQRDGLSLGEACGAVLLETEETAKRTATGITKSILLSGGAISNDANHISGPSRTGDGLYLAIRQAMEEAKITTPNEISFINAHGTATVYNDEMESKAIHLAQLQSVPVNSLKPYFGHTLGASGVIETIICMQQLKEGTLFGTLGYEASGLSMPLIVNADHQPISMKRCVKTASGFGGCNAAIILSLLSDQRDLQSSGRTQTAISTTKAVSITQVASATKAISISQGSVSLNGEELFCSKDLSGSSETDFPRFIREAYKNLGENNMKFYKMDDLCKLGYVAAGYLLKDRCFQPEEIGIVLSNAASSLNTDCKHQSIINRDGDGAASPAVFVYTLPNVVLGEICIRHKIQGENTFFISEHYNEERLTEYARTVMQKGKLKACIIGWCNLLAHQYEADFKLIETL